MTFNPYNTLDIPNLTGPFAAACMGIAGALIPFLFVTQILSEQMKIVDGKKPDYFRVIFNTVIIMFTLFFLYKWMFMKIVAICEAIGMALFNAGDWGNFVDKLSENQSNQINLLQLNVTAFMSAFFSNIISIIESVFYMIRFLLLAVLYSIGPLAFVCGLSPLTRSFLKGWFMATFQVSFWVILFNVMRGILMAVNVDSMSYGDSIAGPIVNGFVISVFSIAIPSITSSLMSSGNLGSLGGAAYGAIYMVGSKYGGRAFEGASGLGKKYGNKSLGALKNVYDKRKQAKEDKKKSYY